MSDISIIGAGSWGTALAQVAAVEGHNVTLWTRDQQHAEKITAEHENTSYLPGIPLSSAITTTSNLEAALVSKILLMVTPAQTMRSILKTMESGIREEHALVLCSKGIEIGSEKLMSDIANEILPGTPVAILTGPNFAHEIASGKPAGSTLACADTKLAEILQNTIGSPYFRTYITTDIIGAQIAGALKNVIAIACGVAHGMEMGESARASLVTRGMAEIVRLGVAMGAKNETFLGLSGMGDMMLTCSSEKSRNFSLGTELGRGKSLNDILSKRKNVTEGIHTAQAAIELAKKHAVDMPVCMAVHKCLNLGVTLDETIHDLLNRPLGYEF